MRLCFEDTERIMSPEMGPKSFGTFEKRAQDQQLPQMETSKLTEIER